MVVINISRDFTTTPGGRFRTEGDFSGEQFREELLEPKYNEAINSGKRLQVNLDGCYGFATSFLEEAFGGLARKLGSTEIYKNIEIICTDEQNLKGLIEGYIRGALE